MLFYDKFLGLKPFLLESTLNKMNDPVSETSPPSGNPRMDPQYLAASKVGILESQQDLELTPLSPKAYINATAQRVEVSEPQDDQSGKGFILSERKADHPQIHIDNSFSRIDVKVTQNTIPHVSEPVKPQSLPQIWLQQAQMVRSGETKTLKMTLHPESLGTLEVEIQLKNGLITGCIRVDTEQAHGLIQKQLPEFMNAMDEHKIPAGAFEMQFRNEQGGHRESHQNQQRERNGFRHHPIEDQADAISKSAAVPSNLKRLDLLA
jgi:flagellar hook-length control protein FliK